MNTLVYNIIKDSGKINFRKIMKKTGLSSLELENILKKLKLDGDILEIGGKYKIFPDDCYLGTVITTSTLRKYIEYEGNKILVSSNFYCDCIINDLVCFRLDEKNEAEIISVVDRPLTSMTCEVVKVNNKVDLIPYHKGLTVHLNRDDMKELLDGDIILVSISSGDIDEYYESRLIKKIGRRDDPLIQDSLIAYNYGFDNEYDEDYLREVDTLPTFVSADDMKGRIDFRTQKCFTIDGKYTKDMDDGVYAEKIDDDIIRVYVHIADVSHYIKKGSLIFDRACDKTTSLYLNNSVFHMLHSKISNGICSLNPYVDRLAKTVIMDIDKNGDVINYDIVKSVINSKKKMVYDEVDCILNNEFVPDGYEDFVNELNVLNEASLRLGNKYLKNGKIEFANTELSMVYNEDGTINSINNPVNSPSSKLIENLMICANEIVGKWLYYLEMPTVYRIHELPDIKRINTLINSLNKQGYNIKHVSDVESPESLQIILDKLKKYDGYNILSQLFVMTMKRARYSIDNRGHYALSLPVYLHFTSPIRRLPDLLVHMVSDIILNDYDRLETVNFDDLEKELNELAIHSSNMQRLADNAEKEAERRLIIDNLENYIGEEFEAVVCEIGKKVRIKLFGIDTFVDSKKFDGNFGFDTNKKLYYDINTHEYVHIGTKIIVRLNEVNKLNNSFKISILGTKNSCIKKRKLVNVSFDK